MIPHVSLVGSCLTCAVCGQRRSLDEDQFPEDNIVFGYLYRTRLEAYEREHAYGVAVPKLPAAPRFQARRSA